MDESNLVSLIWMISFLLVIPGKSSRHLRPQPQGEEHSNLVLATDETDPPSNQVSFQICVPLQDVCSDCPAGPPGAAGIPGVPGDKGLTGPPGKSGQDGFQVGHVSFTLVCCR